MKKVILLLISFFLFFSFTSKIQAFENEKYITIVNPVRISKYNKTPVESLRTQYSTIKDKKLPATWLVTFDVLNDKNMVNEFKKFDKTQEMGIFLEVTKDFSDKVGVKYGSGAYWHHANNVFLSGYTQNERKILIDAVFKKFKENFGYYPKSVGSWWTDAFSLSYMKEKYGIVANLVCSDQFSTDGYRIWGQPWQISYYPSKKHPAVPASSFENSLDLVNIQWASRDPLNGYDSSLYSTQDYKVATNTLDTKYFEKILDRYLNVGELGHIVIGLESDLAPDVYFGEFSKQMDVVYEKSKNNTKIVTMSDFYDFYRAKYKLVSPEVSIATHDFLGSDITSHWYSGTKYRLFYTTDKNGEIKIKDLRIYDQNIIDPYSVSPNYLNLLTINIPSVIDTVQNKNSIWSLPKDTEIKTNKDSIEIIGKNIKVPQNIQNNYLINIDKAKEKLTITFNNLNFNNELGVIVKDLSLEAVHFFRTKSVVLKLIKGEGRDYFKKIEYLIPQDEIITLKYLESLPKGRLLVYDNECLQCSWHTPTKPIVFSNRRNYVKKFSNHDIVYNSSVFKAKTIEELKYEFKKTKVKYIYLVKFEDYAEKLPFSPGDIGIEKIYSSANSEIWEVQ